MTSSILRPLDHKNQSKCENNLTYYLFFYPFGAAQFLSGFSGWTIKLHNQNVGFCQERITSRSLAFSLVCDVSFVYRELYFCFERPKEKERSYTLP